MEREDESAMTEITILPDGRVYVFGMSLPVLELLGELQPDDGRVRQILERVRTVEGSNASAEAIGPAR